MKRKVKISRQASATLVVMVLLAMLVVGCAGGAEDTTTTTAQGSSQPDEIRLAMSDVTRLAPAASDAEVSSVASSLGAFGADLYGVLAADAGEGNLVFSPASIITALAMAYAGAVGPTAQEMATTLHFDLEGDALHQALNSLDTSLESRNRQQSNGEGVLVKTANSLWAQHDLALEQLFLDTLAANYGAGVRLCDFQSAAEEARVAINGWVAGETNDKIPELLAPGVIGAMTRLVLVNAVYLDADWAAPFDPNSTRTGPFTTLDGKEVDAEMMSQTSRFPYALGEDWQAVELPYLGNELAMLVVVPDEGRLTQAEDGLARGLIEDAAEALSTDVDVDLTMPKFEFRTQAGLSDALRALGMEMAFDPGAADFSGMTAQTSLFISDVIHEAFIAVDEEGTEAAAATAVVMEESAIMPGETVTLTIDRPFIFALRDRETGAVLFLGRVTDPSA